MAGPRSLNPTCEDYNSDDSEDEVLESFRRSPAANVAAKRSHPSDLGTDKTPPGADKVVNIDLQSDSGYSSHTAATMSSADSGPSAKSSQSPPTPAAIAAPTPQQPPAHPSRRRQTLVADDRKSSSQNSPRKPLQRNSSVSSRTPTQRRPTGTRSEDCTDPTCTKCVPSSSSSLSRSRRPTSIARDSALDIPTYAAYDQRSQRSDPAPTMPGSPTFSRQQPGAYMQGSAVVQPGQTRRRSSSTTRRPMSYHGDPGQSYWVPGMPAPYPSPPQELHSHGPPPSMSAHFNIHPQMSPFMMGATPPNNYFPPGHPMHQTSPPYDMQRPPLSARNSSNYATRRPTSGFGPTLVTYEQGNQPMPSARYSNAPQSARQERFPQSHFEDDSTASESEYSEEEEPRNVRNDRALMPPPKVKPSRRPSLRPSKTAQVLERGLSQSQTLPERPRERDPRASRISTAPSSSSRAQSKHRPTLIQHPDAHSSYDTRTQSSAKVLVENSRSRRRQSYQAYERDYSQKEYEVEQKRRNRDSKIYRDEREDAIVIPERRRRADTAASRRDEYVAENKNQRAAVDAEAYQNRVRGSEDPLVQRVHEAAKRASRVPSIHSEDSSSRSGGDRASRISHSNRTTVTNGGGNGEIRLRVDASAPLSLSFNGDMEGRTLQINPAENGMADIVIGNSRGNESTYRSEKGSVMGSNSKKSLIANPRRDAEESSVRSARSSQGRREERERPRGVLRRRRDTEYS